MSAKKVEQRVEQRVEREEHRAACWPKDCAWPTPTEYAMQWDEDVIPNAIDEDTEELLAVKEYYDSLVGEGKLNEDYSLNDEIEDEFEDHLPSLAVDYWDDGFLYDVWLEDLSTHLNLLKIAPMDAHKDPTVAIRSIISYEFVNENLLRQAFTRRAFQIEYKKCGLEGCSEELEFLGDSILNQIVTKAIIEQFAEVNCVCVSAPFQSRFNEGELSRIRANFISKEHLSARAREMGLGQFILYGTGEEESESSLEDMMEALIGAVAMDSNWNMEVLEGVVDRLIALHLEHPDLYLKKGHYELFNAWHQRNFGCIPEYNIYRKTVGDNHSVYECVLKFQLPDNDRGIWTAHTVTAQEASRSLARERAADKAMSYVQSNGLWLNWKNAGIVPDKDKAINQLQELYQKKYLEEKPEYEFEAEKNNVWRCDCVCCGVHGFGRGMGKTDAKKKAAYMALIVLMKTAGVDVKDFWNEIMQGMMTTMER